MSGKALAEARAEVRRGARVRAPEIETGGMLLGAFDDAAGIVHVDKVTGPPPDSYLSATYFHHGVQGTQERVSAEVRRTASTIGFVGFWHSHPSGRAYPSETDEQGMAAVVAPDGTTRRALMMIVVATMKAGVIGVTCAGAPDIYFRVVPRSACRLVSGHPGTWVGESPAASRRLVLPRRICQTRGCAEAASRPRTGWSPSPVVGRRSRP